MKALTNSAANAFPYRLPAAPAVRITNQSALDCAELDGSLTSAKPAGTALRDLLNLDAVPAEQGKEGNAVSYTHLTLPTILLV